jgi:hypothetical protein
MGAPQRFESTFSDNANQWHNLLAEIADAIPPGANGAVTVHTDPTGTTLRHIDGTEPHFTPAEWTAFRSGAQAHEFDLPA